MRILQVLAGAEHGGAETAFVDMCLAMQEKGQQIEVATRPNDLRVKQLKNAGIAIHLLPFGGALDIWTAARLKKIIADFKPDIVQTWMSRASKKTPKWNPKSNAPRYFNVARLGGYYKAKYFKNTDYFVTITPDIKEHLIKCGFEGDKIRHINNFAEAENAEQPVSRKSLDTPDKATVLLALGRLHNAKAFDTLMRAVSKLEQDNVYLWIAGEGPDREKLESLRDELNLTERVKFLGWRDDRAALFMAADICVFPSRYEPFGTVFVQSWAHKTPLITSNASGPKQFVNHGEDALVFSIDDEIELSRHIKTLTTDKTLSMQLVANGYERYLNEFTKDQCVDAYLSWYQHIMNTENKQPNPKVEINAQNMS